ncbi:TPT-domain-containing protein [Dendrothele bispora CBS 962.96]|uniref:TPT-domain-containing protein n=1 Tax=Dendrothele bispora (strain CBS 962.96) TaxID=1314807 RepID=A0A4S8LT99_DENBC|nr:TPT-domain-containing protein [Dendrothele bispora CBS 962.96]
MLLCGLWYTSSALSSNTGKSILTQFRYPITLTFVQFGFIALYCLLFMSPIVGFSRLRRPTKAIVQSTLPMGMFQVGGHVFSSMAISRIPVSTVHTIKALSPLFTVAAYALLFGVSYSTKTYISLLPLTFGVMLACSFDMSASNAIGLLCAFGSAVVFVSSNIFFKKIMPSNSNGGTSQPAHKLDKINLLFYSSGMAFLLMIPIWLYYDLPIFMSSSTNVAHPSHGHSTPHSVYYYFFTNGTVHFAQNIIAFIILSSTSPVTYSIASLIKRVAVICIAIVWFAQTVHPVQGFGIMLTFGGLYMYNNAKGDVERGEKKMRRVEAAREMMLPTTKADARLMSGTETPPSEPFLPASESAESSALGSATTMHGRPRAPSYHNGHVHPPNNLSVKITPPVFTSSKHSPKDGRVISPTDSYPSPPPSLDSPISESAPYLPNGGLYNIQEHVHTHPSHRTEIEVIS